MASIAYRQNQQARAFAMYSSARDLWEKLPDESGRTGAYLGLAKTLEAMDEPDRAQVYYQKAREILERSNRAGELAEVIASIGRIVAGAGDLKKAVALMEKATSLYRTAGDTSATARALIEWGQYLEQTEAVAQARERYEQALSLVETAKGPRDLVFEAKLKLASLQLAQSRVREAREIAHSMIESLRTTKSKEGTVGAPPDLELVQAYWIAGLSAFRAGDPTAALQFFKKGLPLASSAGLVREMSVHALGLSMVYASLGRFLDCLHCVDLGLAVLSPHLHPFDAATAPDIEKVQYPAIASLLFDWRARAHFGLARVNSPGEKAALIWALNATESSLKLKARAAHTSQESDLLIGLTDPHTRELRLMVLLRLALTDPKMKVRGEPILNVTRDNRVALVNQSVTRRKEKSTSRGQ